MNPDTISQILDSLETSMRESERELAIKNGGLMHGTRLYAQGYTDAIRAMRNAFAFGIAPRSPRSTAAEPRMIDAGAGRDGEQ